MSCEVTVCISMRRMTGLTNALSRKIRFEVG
jgi:hypothetical protein